MDTQVTNLENRVASLESALSTAVSLLKDSGYSQATLATTLGISRWQVRRLLENN